MNTGRYTFVLDIPPNFQRDVLARRSPSVQLAVDATAMMQAGIGSGYALQIVNTEVAQFVARTEVAPPPGVNLAVRIAFNPNVTTSWFMSIMAIINNITMLAIILAGAAIIREREHGTMDHLLVMPLTPFEIAMAKVWANGLVITVAVGLSLAIVVRVIWASRSPARSRCSCSASRSTCSSPPRSASCSAPSRARCRSSASSTS